MTVKQYVEISEDVEIDLDIEEIYDNLSRCEKEDLLEMLLEHRINTNSKYSIEGLIVGRCDSEVLNSKRIWDKIIRLIKYDEPALKDYIIEELSYEPPSVN